MGPPQGEVGPSLWAEGLAHQEQGLQLPRPPRHCQGLSKAVCVQSVPGGFGKGGGGFGRALHHLGQGRG